MARWTATATAVLLQSADDLGAKGVDNTFGNGLLDLTRAFQPIGTLSVTQANGQSVQVPKTTVVKATGGALGPLTALRGVLSNYTTFDSFRRDFKVDLSGLVSAARGSGALLNLAQGGDFAVGGLPLGANSRLAFSWTSTPNAAQTGAGPFSARPTSASSALAVGFSTRITQRWRVGATYSSLAETDGILGTTYQSGGLLDFGARHHSQSIALSSALTRETPQAREVRAETLRMRPAAVGVPPVRAWLVSASRATPPPKSKADDRATDWLCRRSPKSSRPPLW